MPCDQSSQIVSMYQKALASANQRVEEGEHKKYPNSNKTVAKDVDRKKLCPNHGEQQPRSIGDMCDDVLGSPSRRTANISRIHMEVPLSIDIHGSLECHVESDVLASLTIFTGVVGGFGLSDIIQGIQNSAIECGFYSVEGPGSLVQLSSVTSE